MRMADIISEMSALSTNCTFCHSFAPPCNSLSLPVLSDSQHVYSNRFIFILQANFKKNIKILLTKYDQRKTVSNEWVFKELINYESMLLKTKIRSNKRVFI